MKKTLESPLKVELNYSASLGPTVDDPNIFRADSYKNFTDDLTDNFTQR
ncbi:MAG: hypothetical protein LBD75_02915 [Candidatus Peribacteria bacterium]|nr:hypothetical protein [Candidatus Peribacteria bacterium]